MWIAPGRSNNTSMTLGAPHDAVAVKPFKINAKSGRTFKMSRRTSRTSRTSSASRKSVFKAPPSTFTNQRSEHTNTKSLQVLLTCGSPLTGVGFKLRMIMKNSRSPLVCSALYFWSNFLNITESVSESLKVWTKPSTAHNSESVLSV